MPQQIILAKKAIFGLRNKQKRAKMILYLKCVFHTPLVAKFKQKRATKSNNMPKKWQKVPY